MTGSDWMPELYHRFAGERTRPALDLLAQVPLAAPARVVDLGCGSGLSTAPLKARFAEAEVVGLDTSPAMLEAARAAVPEARFAVADALTWQAEAPVDLLFSNALLQWLPDHAALLPRLLAQVAPGGVFAYQVPVNLGEPSHRAMAEAAAALPFKAKLAEAAAARERMPTAAEIWDILAPHAAKLEIWDTIYQHVMPDHAAIVQWLRATGLRPWLARLDDAEQATFLAAYEARLEQVYPRRVDGKVLLAFPRRFVVAVARG
jgi:trans-aconitate 2-methyltransferase